MDVLVELTRMYLQRVTGVTVQEPAAGNSGIQNLAALLHAISNTNIKRNYQALWRDSAKKQNPDSVTRVGVFIFLLQELGLSD